MTQFQSITSWLLSKWLTILYFIFFIFYFFTFDPKQQIKKQTKISQVLADFLHRCCVKEIIKLIHVSDGFYCFSWTLDFTAGLHLIASLVSAEDENQLLRYVMANNMSYSFVSTMLLLCGNRAQTFQIKISFVLRKKEEKRKKISAKTKDNVDWSASLAQSNLLVLQSMQQ